MKKIIVNADDFGYRTEINKAVIFAYKNGIVKSTTVLTDRQAFEEAAVLAKENPGLSTGLHIDLDKYFNIQHGAGIVHGWLNGNVPSKDVLKSEIKRQTEKMLSAGMNIDHFDSHHHTHMFEEVFYVMTDICKEYKINKIRFFEKFCKDKNVAASMKTYAMHNGIKFPEHFIDGWYYGNIDEDFNVAEIMTHPGYAEAWREEELRICCDAELKSYCKNKDIVFTDYSGF